jgi:anti-sigma regulatory factor (Ser/Thr protein kinase)
MTAMLSDRLVVGNDIADLRRIATWLRESGAASDIPKDLVFMLDVCANEAVSNIISYAYDDGNRHEITLELNRTAKGARLIIRDDGKPFNMLEAPEHKQPRSLQDATVGGLGIHLIRRLMAHCEYHRADGINVLTFEAHRLLQTGDA